MRKEAHRYGEAFFKRWSFQQWPPQTAPLGGWHTWLFVGGRGAGKTRAGAEWVKSLISRGIRVALVGPSLSDVREVMIEGPSGLKAIADKGNVPRYEVSRRRLVWPKGGEAYAFSAEDVDSLRGPQFHYAWADEFCAWRRPAEMLAQVRLGLRLGRKPRLCLTTTPRPISALKTLMTQAGVAVTRFSTHDNRIALSEGFIDGLRALYGGTRLAAQELEGLIVDDGGAALWKAEDFERVYGPVPERFDEIVVAVDPPASARGDACGIIVAGRWGERAFVIEDATVSGCSPLGWASNVAAAAKAYGAQRIVAEANQGGDMVRAVIAAVPGCRTRVEMVRAVEGKRARAEPVAALYEQGRVIHAPVEAGTRFLALEEELMALGSVDGPGRSPDRADALVWAVTALLIGRREAPRLRRL